MGPLWRLICVPAIAGAGYIAADRAVLREIGLEPVGRGLEAVRAHLPRAIGGKPRIRQGGQACHWELASADDALLSGLPLLAPSPFSYAGMGNGTLGGYGGGLDGRDFAALAPNLRAADLLTSPGLLPLEEAGPLRTAEAAPPTDVPEPPAWAIFGAGLAALAAAVRRRAWR